MANEVKKYHHTALGADGKVYEFFCIKFPNGAYDMQTMESREVTDPHYCAWYKAQVASGKIRA